MYSDPNARWGWDSYRERHFYGYSLYVFTAAPYDLPIYLRPAQAPRHDSVLAVVSLAELRELYPNWIFAKALYDAAHDTYPIYQLHRTWGIEPFIDLNNRRKDKRQYPAPIKVDDKGTPFCIADQPMVHHGFMRDRNRHKWRCPLACGKIESCDKKAQCSPSSYGRVIYTKPDWDPRIFTTTPRGSRRWKKIFDGRTSVERTFKRMTFDYQTESTRSRSTKGFFIRQVLAAINVHLDAQVKHNKITLTDLIDNQVA